MTGGPIEEVTVQRSADRTTHTPPVNEAGRPLLTVDRIACLFLVCACLFTFGRQIYVKQGYYFVGDDWPLLHLGLSWGGYLQPYNEHLSIASVATYRVSGLLFGINQTLPIQVFAAFSYASIAIVLFAIAKSRVGSGMALLAACAVLFYPSFDVVPSAFNHYLALVGIVVAAGLLPKRERRYDWAVFAVLCLALASSGVAVAGSAGCLAVLVLIRPSWRRWLSVLVPCAFWLAWFERYSPGAHASRNYPLDTLSRHVWRGTMSSFRGLAFDSHVGGLMLAIALVILFVLRCRHGLRAITFTLCWMLAEIGWWVGIRQARVFTRHPADIFRYRLVGSVFIILALLPTDPRQLGAAIVPRLETRGWRYMDSRPACVGFVAACLLFVFMNPVAGGRSSQEFDNRLHSWLIIQEAAINMGPRVVPNDAMISSPMLDFQVSQYRQVVRAYGYPTGSTPADFDRFLVRRQSIALQTRPNKAPISCVDRAAVISVPPMQALVMQAGERAVDVRVRYLGQNWIPVGRIQPGRRRALNFPWMIVDRDWQVEAPGACSVVRKRGA